MRVALLNIWFGPLPDYFPFFARTCAYNHPMFHWHVFTDAVTQPAEYNDAVSLVPYTWDDLYRDCPWLTRPREIVTLQRWPRHGWPCRMALMWAKTWNCDFIGTSDCDVIFGDLPTHMPDDLGQYDMVTAHAGTLCHIPRMRNCISFSFYRREAVPWIREYVEERDDALDDNYVFSDWFAGRGKVFSAGKNIQPIGESLPGWGKLPMSYKGLWADGKITVEGIPGGLWHMLPFKTDPGFRVHPQAVSADCWHLSRAGILPGKTYL
jgi:hypothetical protein